MVKAVVGRFWRIVVHFDSECAGLAVAVRISHSVRENELRIAFEIIGIRIGVMIKHAQLRNFVRTCRRVNLDTEHIIVAVIGSECVCASIPAVSDSHAADINSVAVHRREVD